MEATLHLWHNLHANVLSLHWLRLRLEQKPGRTHVTLIIIRGEGGGGHLFRSKLSPEISYFSILFTGCGHTTCLVQGWRGQPNAWKRLILNIHSTGVHDPKSSGRSCTWFNTDPWQLPRPHAIVLNSSHLCMVHIALPRFSGGVAVTSHAVALHSVNKTAGLFLSAASQTTFLKGW